MTGEGGSEGEPMLGGERIIYFEKNAFGDDEKEGQLILSNLHKNCMLKE